MYWLDISQCCVLPSAFTETTPTCSRRPPKPETETRTEVRLSHRLRVASQRFVRFSLRWTEDEYWKQKRWRLHFLSRFAHFTPTTHLRQFHLKTRLRAGDFPNTKFVYWFHPDRETLKEQFCRLTSNTSLCYFSTHCHFLTIWITLKPATKYWRATEPPFVLLMKIIWVTNKSLMSYLFKNTSSTLLFLLLFICIKLL